MSAVARAPRILVVIPALDEEEALPRVLAELPAEPPLTVVVADNGSSDGTARVAAAAGAIVVSEPRRGYGSACLAALAAIAQGRAGELRDEDVIVFLDADHSDYPEELPAIVAPLLAGRAQLVLGSRVLGGASMRALLPQAWLGNRLATFLMRALFGAPYTDLGPFRAIRWGDLRALGMRDPGMGWTVEMQLKAWSAGLEVLEVPVRYRERIGRSKITGTLTGTLRAGAKILWWIARWRVRLPRRARSVALVRARNP